MGVRYWAAVIGLWVFVVLCGVGFVRLMVDIFIYFEAGAIIQGGVAGLAALVFFGVFCWAYRGE
jgi:hypothetical protein